MMLFATLIFVLAIVVNGKKSSLLLLPSCNGCFSEVNGIAYACCSDMTINNGYCTCNNGPCTQCAPVPTDKKKPLGPVSTSPLSTLPSCGGCYSGVNGISFTCADCIISIVNGQCTCGDGSACMQCSPSAADKEVKPVALPSCGGCYTGINGVNYACCNGMTINNGACSCFGGTPCTQCSPSEKDKVQAVPVKGRCKKCFSAFEGTFFDCCPNQTFVHGECFCGEDGRTSCTKCELSAEEHKVAGLVGSDFCWNPSCGMFSGTCCSQGKQCCYDNSQSNPCTADCGCVCGGSWSCPANSYRVPYFNWASVNGTCNRAMGATSDTGCLYDSGSCQPWCLCRPGYRSTEGCLINGQAPVLVSGQCIPMNEHEMEASLSQKLQVVKSFDLVGSGEILFTRPMHAVGPKVSGILSINGTTFGAPFYAGGLVLTSVGCYGPVIESHVVPQAQPQLVAQIQSCANPTLSIAGLYNPGSDDQVFDLFSVNFVVQNSLQFMVWVSGRLADGTFLSTGSYLNSNCVPAYVGYNSPIHVIFNFSFCY